MRHYFTKEAVTDEHEAISAVKQWAYTLEGNDPLKPLFDRIGDAGIVMLGEASHGTHEYYTWRNYISQRLIREKGFQLIAVEGDWPDCYRVNRFIKGYEGSGKTAKDVLHQFNCWPTWLWANKETIELISWLRNYNDHQPRNKKVGFYGLDIYSLWESIDGIIAYLRKEDPSALQIAEKAFDCFEPYRDQEGISYAKAAIRVPELCENEVVHLLREIRQKKALYNIDQEEIFSAEQNALIAVNAEQYYRSIIQGGAHSWNVRDRHMAETLERLIKRNEQPAKVIVWEHNTHIGDARATDMVDEGMLNIGELARMQHADRGVVLVGFGSYEGTVIAARNWRAEMEVMQMPPARTGSWESMLHAAGTENKLLLMDDFTGNDTLMENHIPHRAIGVVYDPRYEKYGNYVPSIIPLRYDAFIYLDKTQALHPLHIGADKQQMPETYPFGT